MSRVSSTAAFLRPVDRLTILFLLTITIMLVFFHRGIENWPGFVLSNLTFIASLILFAWIANLTQWKPLQFFHYVYPLIFYTLFFVEIGKIMNILFDFWLESTLIKWDLALFGVHPTVWLQQFYRPWLNEFMAFSYWSYYILFPFTALVLYFRKDKTTFHSFVFSLSLTLYLCYLSYLFLSARGPHETLAELHVHREVAGFFDMFVKRIQDRAGVSGAAFPSSHVAAVWIMLIYLYRDRKWLAWTALPLILCLTFSVVYMRYHYAVDAIAGVLVPCLTYPLSQYLEKRSFLKKRQ